MRFTDEMQGVLMLGQVVQVSRSGRPAIPTEAFVVFLSF
jgi:hypothetical protein